MSSCACPTPSLLYQTVLWREALFHSSFTYKTPRLREVKLLTRKEPEPELWSFQEGPKIEQPMFIYFF